MACDCIKRINNTLKERFNDSAILNIAFMEDGTERILIKGMYHKKNKKGEYQQKWTDINIVSQFCPICGKPYDTKEES